MKGKEPGAKGVEQMGRWALRKGAERRKVKRVMSNQRINNIKQKREKGLKLKEVKVVAMNSK